MKVQIFSFSRIQICCYHCVIIMLLANERCNQAGLRTLLSVRPSVRPTVTPFPQCYCYRIMKFSGVITIDKIDFHAKGQGQRSRSQRSWPHKQIPEPMMIKIWDFTWLYNSWLNKSLANKLFLATNWPALSRKPLIWSIIMVMLWLKTGLNATKVWL